MTSFVPVNIPISFGMIIVAPTPFNTILWQFINQTYNCALNYGNRNASSTYTVNDIATSYAAALAASISVSLAIRKALESRTKNMRGTKLIFFNTISSFFACSTAGFLNCQMMRKTEVERGIDVFESKEQGGRIIGKS